MKMKIARRILILGLIISYQLAFSQTKIDSLIYELKKPKFYPTVAQSKEELIDKGKEVIPGLGKKEVIPGLIELLFDTSYVKLRNTADLIYPGATEFYGHGPIIRYDIDWICVRAGWVLEELTFQDFGYKQNHISEEELFKLIKSNYQTEYLEKGKYAVNFKDTTELGKLKEFRKHLAIKVKKWWIENKDNWNRFVSIKEALISNNSNRMLNAMDYLRYGETYCEDLTEESFSNDLRPIIKSIEINGKNGTQIQAKLLLQDTEYYWLKIKKKNKSH